MHSFRRSESQHGAKRDRRKWRHPRNRVGDLTYQIASAIAVMEMGIHDYSTIAKAVGLTIEEVRRIDMAEAASVRQLAAAGIPAGECFKLVNHLRCPRCYAKIALVPCIACRNSLQILADHCPITEIRYAG